VMKDWSTLEQVAAAMRRLNRAVATFELPDAELHEIAEAVTELSRRVEGGELRDKQRDHETLPSGASGDDRAALTTRGDELEFDPLSLGGGRLHPASVGIDFRRDGPTSVIARCTVHGMFQGPPGRVHGGVVALIIDELMGTVNRIAARRAFTARLQIHLRAAAPVDVELTFRAWEHEVDGRKIFVRAEGRHGDTLIVEADALFIVPRPSDDLGSPGSDFPDETTRSAVR
jgi:acyl-coenzyme A thioesterase PaaI-like protein